jgi:MYXO-CTERM domain-containing protein
MTRTRRTVTILCALVPTTASAYSTPALYPADAARDGGGGGRAFTGSPGDGFTCSVCHTGGPAPTLQLRGGPGPLVEPGATYMFELSWPEAHVGLVVEASDDDGRALGALQLPPTALLLPEERCTSGSRAAVRVALANERAVLGLGDCGARLLRFQWTAPDPLVPGALYIAAVAADGDETLAGDGALAKRIPLGPPATSAGCTIDPTQPPWALLALPLLALTRRRRRTPSILFHTLLLTLLLGGCARVQPYQRGRLAQPDMQLTPDPDLDAGPEHALEYREGSAGGIGGGGGGCGCN